MWEIRKAWTPKRGATEPQSQPEEVGRGLNVSLSRCCDLRSTFWMLVSLYKKGRNFFCLSSITDVDEPKSVISVNVLWML